MTKPSKTLAAAIVAALLVGSFTPAPASACGPFRGLFGVGRCAAARVSYRSAGYWSQTSAGSCYGGACPTVGSCGSSACGSLAGSCAGGACPIQSSTAVDYRVYLGASTEYIPLPSRACEIETSTPPAPCESVQTTTEPVPPCGPIQSSTSCDQVAEAQFVNASGVSAPCPIRQSVGAFVAAANAIRVRYGLRPLREDASLVRGAEIQVSTCRSRGALVHGTGVDEILAQNQTGFDAALTQWLASPAHRALLLSPSFTMAGVAVTRDAYGRAWCAMRFR